MADRASLVEREYRARMAALTPKERMARSVAMFNWTREMIGRQILKQEGPMDFERLRWKVAMRQYGSDPRMRAMIQEMLNRVSG